MAEIKHSFTGGKMNKDLDIRLVPQGQYRDAVNIQVRTTDGGSDGQGDGGVVQNLEGNTNIGYYSGNESSGDTVSVSQGDMTCVGSVGDEKTNNAYFLFTPKDQDAESYNATTSIVTMLDTIVEQNVDTNACSPVVVDIWRVHSPIANVITDFTQFTSSTINITLVAGFTSRIRENMTLTLYNTANDNSAFIKIKKIDGNIIRLYDPIDASSWDSSTFTHAEFEHPRVLNLHPDNHVTAINIIDDLLFFTDGVHEPKKINITRCKAGTTADIDTHTQLLITNNNGDLVDAGDVEFSDANLGNVNNDLLEEHVTVLRPAPKTAPTIHVDARDVAELKFTVNEYLNTSGLVPWISGGVQPIVGDELQIGLSYDTSGTAVNIGISSPELSQIPLIQGDVLTVTQEEVEVGFDAVDFKVEFLTYLDEASTTSVPVDFVTNKIRVKVLTEPSLIIENDMTSWSFEVTSLEKPKFELKFARFGYRYKYEDGEYSAFSPFSELAFDPGLFDYDVKKGHNLGMINTIRELTIKDFIPYYTDRALDIVEVEVLYKSTDNPTVYSIKSIKKVRDNEWELFTPNDTTVDNNNTTQLSIETGSLTIKSETIHRAIPSNQILRAFDNVPRHAKAQEITGSRVVYGNYVQGFDLTYPVGLTQNVVSEPVNGQPKRSVKTIRDYKVGMVFGDKYGRETPVIVSNRLIDLDSDPTTTNYIVETDDVRVKKQLAAMSNKLLVQQDWNKLGLPASTPDTMEWMDYVKYYVKETSNEYYSMVMDRWYYAEEQENIWLSFPSADRNKVDIETYLELKKAHGENIPVLEDARYKIIAIENEAPDFIKIDHRFMGEVRLGSEFTHDGGGDVVNTADPTLLIDPDRGKAIDIGPDEYQNFLDTYGPNKRGQLLARVVGRTINNSTGVTVNKIVSGDFKKVTNFSRGTVGSTDNVATIRFNKSFGESANMRERFTLAGYALNLLEADPSANDLNYFLEFKEEVVENKPEFDGRFFVLIEKDEPIEKYVEKITASSIGFTEIDQVAISYVDSQTYSPAKSGPYSYVGGGNTAFGSTGVYADLDAESTGSANVTDTSNSPYIWWGWGEFSENPAPQGLSNDPIQANFFALGCQRNGVLQGIGVEHFDDNFGSNSADKVINYGAITRAYWENFLTWHQSTLGTSYANIAGLGINIRNRVFLDGARATKYRLQEFGTNSGNTTEMGIRGNASDPAAGYGLTTLSNDDTEYSTPPYIFNYKPTALDTSADPTAVGMCRMVFSQTKGVDGSQDSWGAEGTFATDISELNGVGGALTVYNYFTTPGTYFRFLDDGSGPGGEPHTYVVVESSPDGSVSLPIQYSNEIKNFGRAFDNDEVDDDDNQFKEKVISTTQPVTNNNNPFGPDISSPSSTAYDSTTFLLGGDGAPETDLRWGGENANCVDENNNTIDCWSILKESGASYLTGSQLDFYVSGSINSSYPAEPIKIKVGCRKNNIAGDPGGNDGNFLDQAICRECKGSQRGCNRHSIRFEFRKVDEVTGEILNEGITDLEAFDPRGQAKHDGSAGAIRFSILQRALISGGDVIEAETDRGVWETEPKEGEELDIYYEATHALPMKLEQGNTLAYAPLKSRVFSQYFDIEGGNQINSLTTDLDGNLFKDIKVGGAEYTQNESIIKVISTNADDVVGVHKGGIGIGDHISFEHSSGLITKSEVEKYYKAPSGSNVTYVAGPTVDVTITFDGGVTDDLPQGTISITNQDGSAFNDVSAFAVSDGIGGHGASVVGDDVPGNIFLKHFPPFGSFGGNNQLTDVRWITGFDEADPDAVAGTSFDVTLHFQTGYYQIKKDVYQYAVQLGWHNCYSFGNGVESDRIRDDFNAPQIDNGVRVSATIDDFGQENKTSSLIYSGLYNTTSGVNDLNEFNMGEKIIKDLNPAYGSIQRLKSRDTDVIAFCEDRILRILANKEAVFNADGNPQLTATDRVLGQVSTFLGDYGISNNPESLAVDQYRMYFTDTQRGAVLRLSRDGLTPISSVGMKTWFRKNLKNKTKLLGNFDTVNGEYNLTFTPSPANGPTISFNETSKGWVSFKSFKPDEGLSISGQYLTVKDGTIWKHYSPNVGRNLFYGATSLNSFSESKLEVVFNDAPGQVKSFKAMNYEGSQSRVIQNLDDYDYYNLIGKNGWWVDALNTDLQEGRVVEFIDKENKWFNRIQGIQSSQANLDTNEFTVQGIGNPTVVELPEVAPSTFTFTIQNDTSNDPAGQGSNNSGYSG
jgi:hypothetical protein